jgi:WD40 repeat protein
VRDGGGVVKTFSDHINRVHRTGVAFSPCMRYVATGSEDRACYIYDVRAGGCVQKLTGHTDVCSAIAFNPLFPQCATGSLDSTVRFYSE